MKAASEEERNHQCCGHNPWGTLLFRELEDWIKETQHKWLWA